MEARASLIALLLHDEDPSAEGRDAGLVLITEPGQLLVRRVDRGVGTCHIRIENAADAALFRVQAPRRGANRRRGGE